MAKLDSIVVAQQNSYAQIVGWQYIPFGAQEPEKATVSIYHSYVQNESFELIGRVAANKGWFLDESSDFLDRWQVSYYKLVLDVDGKKTEYGPVYLSYQGTAKELSLIKHTRTYLRLGGVPVLIYQNLEDGERCPDCWDPVLKRVTRSNCECCYGTGFIKGYHAPVLTLGQLGVEGKQNVVNERLEQEASVEMLFSNYPILRPGDVIYIVDKGRRYRIQQILPAQSGELLINQSAVGYGLLPSDIEHEIPIPDISTITPILKRKFAPHRQVSSTDGEEFDYSTFDNIRY